jgi:hypothetical protein
MNLRLQVARNWYRLGLYWFAWKAFRDALREFRKI